MKNTALNHAALLLTLLSATASAHADNWTGNVGVYLGQKQLDDTDWARHDAQSTIAMVLDVKPSQWPVSIALDLFGTGDEAKQDGVKHEAYTAEAHLGLRKVFQLPIENCKFRPYVGAGIALVHAEAKSRRDSQTTSDDDADHGYWLGVGTYFRATEHVNLGVDVRYSKAKLTLLDTERDAGGVNIGVGVGYHW